MAHTNRTLYDPIRDELYHPQPDLHDRMREEDYACESCAYWNHARNAPVHARVNGVFAVVAQCLRTGEDNAPYADVVGPEAAVFTQATSRCNAFLPHPDLILDDALAHGPIPHTAHRTKNHLTIPIRKTSFRKKP